MPNEMAMIAMKASIAFNETCESLWGEDSCRKCGVDCEGCNVEAVYNIIMQNLRLASIEAYLKNRR